MENLDPLFNPRSVAVIGATESPARVGYYPLKNLIDFGFTGEIYPVNPRLSRIFGLKAYPSLEAIPGEVDMAVIVVMADSVPSVLKDCARKGVKGVVIPSTGFKELGMESGEKLQDEIVAIANKAEINIIGPNTMGLLNSYANLNATLEPSFKDVIKGDIAVICQSGGVCAFLLSSMINENLGVSLAMGLGNRGNLDFADIIEYLGQHQQTRAIALYIEGLDDPHRFIEAARKVTAGKPIVAYKVAGEHLGQATYSHTASLAGRYEVYHSAFSRAGVILVDDLTGLMDVAKAMAFQSPPRGNRVAILSGQAGPGIVAADACHRHGLALAEFSARGKERLGDLVGTPSFSENPFDMGAAPIKDTIHIFHEAFEVMLSEEGVDAIVVSCVYHPLNVPIIDSFINLLEPKAITKPVIAFGSSPDGINDGQIARLEKNRVPVYPLPDRAVKALVGLVKYGMARQLNQ
ncbi:acetate--CoA ligase family protein [Chloroflexota bacterium]